MSEKKDKRVATDAEGSGDNKCKRPKIEVNGREFRHTVSHLWQARHLEDEERSEEILESCSKKTQKMLQALESFQDATRNGSQEACKEIWSSCDESMKDFFRHGSRIDNYEYDRGASFDPLHIAAENGHLEIVRLFLDEYQFDVNQCDQGETPLGAACHQGDLKMCHYLLKAGANPDNGGYDYAPAVDCSGGGGTVLSPLWAVANWAVRTSNSSAGAMIDRYSQSASIARLLFEYGASARVDASVHHESSLFPTELAIKSGNEALLRVLLENEADLPLFRTDILFPCSFTGIFQVLADFFAKSRNLRQIIGSRVRKAVDDLEEVWEADEAGRRAYNWKRKPIVEFLRRLREAGIDSERKLRHNLPHTVGACCTRSTLNGIPALEGLLEDGAQIDDIDEITLRSKSGLHVSVENGRIDYCRWLLEKGATIDLVDGDGFTALQLATYFAKEAFASADASSDASSDEGQPDAETFIPICDLLLQYGADPFVEAEGTSSAFEVAMCLDDTRLLQQYLEKWNSGDGTSDARNKDGDLPLHVAVCNSDVTLWALNTILERNSRALSVFDGEGQWLPLHLACMWDGSLSVVFKLLQSSPETLQIPLPKHA